MEKTKRITKAQRFADIKALLSGEAPANGTDVTAAIEFIDRELELLARKNTSDKKPTKTQELNEVLKSRILDFLSTQTEGVTCTEVKKSVPELDIYENQKVASLLRVLKEDGKVVKNIVKGKPLFSLA